MIIVPSNVATIKNKPSVKGVALSSWWSGANSVTMPSHSPGDLLLMWAINEGNTFAYTSANIPAGSGTGTIPSWTIVSGSSMNGYYPGTLFSAVATSSNHTSGTWQTYKPLISIVVSGQASTSPIVVKNVMTSGFLGNGLQLVTYPSVTLTNSDNSSLLLYLGSFFENGGSLNGFYPSYPTPTGYTQHFSQTRSDYGNSGTRVFSKDDTTSAGTVTGFGWYSDSGGYDCYTSLVVEILS